VTWGDEKVTGWCGKLSVEERTVGDKGIVEVEAFDLGLRLVFNLRVGFEMAGVEGKGTIGLVGATFGFGEK